MAKQGINPVEQHVEKIVLGLAVLLFAFVVYSYVIVTPVTVVVDGRPITLGELDRALGDAAQRVSDVYKQASFVPPTDTGSATSALPELQKALVDLGKPVSPMVPPNRWWPEMQKPDGLLDGSIGGRHGLASVGAPTISGVFSGVTNAGMVSQSMPLEALTLGGATPGATPVQLAAGSGQDVVWAFLRLNFDMQEQFDNFLNTGYTREQANLILFMEVQVQRQRVLPDGSTGPWEDINPYKTIQVNYPQAVTIREDGTLQHSDEQALRTLFDGLKMAQQEILYPLPQILGGDPFPPYGVPTPAADTTAPGPKTPPVITPRQPPRTTRSPRGPAVMPGGGPGGGESGMRVGGVERAPGAAPTMGAGPSIDKAALAEANRAIGEADRAVKERRFEDARIALEKARGVAQVKQQFDRLDAQILAALTKKQDEEARAAARKADSQARNAEIWVYDMQAPAGKACRYRARLVLFNVFAHPDSDRVGELKDIQDGRKVALVGEWSAPSAPITVADSRYFFFTASQQEKEQANVEVFRFQQGRWYKDFFRNLAVGDPIGDIKAVTSAGSRTEVDYRTGYVVVDVASDNAATVGSDNKGAKLTVKRQPSPVLVSMDPDGAIQSRWMVIDRVCPMYKELDSKAKAALEPLAPTASGAPRVP